MTYLLETVVVGAGGLTGLKTEIINSWIGPIFLVAVAIFAVMFIKDRQWMKLIGFVGIAAVVGLLIFSGSTLFGSKSGDKTGLAGVANQAATGVANDSRGY